MTTPEHRAAELGLVMPDYANPPFGLRYGPLKAFHHTGNTLTLAGMTPEDRAGNKLHPGRVGANVTPEQGRAAARMAGCNVLGLIRHAVGSLDEVTSFVQTLCYVVTTEEFTEVHEVSNGANDLFLEVFGDRVGRMTSATFGVVNLSGGNVFEIVTTVETRSPAS
ncbi:RidA family protein [Microbacterium sp. A204]|uniref:RidA family protein n=1 Tax=Microbacterium sp. A204 TaxID=3457321 RepID=UPI003FD4C03F